MAIFYVLTRPAEHFWGGYFPVPYAGQCIQEYGRTGLDAATDQGPVLIINTDDYNINPNYAKIN